ncbi:MAG: mediator of RNA polymerase II transcription subunit 13 [Bathelium mastoideum]|nr:MAG: mediator of RNA polymerase II transcription subunit 13 [Bathelium mastoideum]
MRTHLAQDGFSNVHYCTYNVTPELSDPANASRLLWRAQIALRDHTTSLASDPNRAAYLVVSDVKRATLWVFTGPNAGPDSPSGDFPAFTVVKNIINEQYNALEYGGRGSFQAANLGELNGRSTVKPTTASRASNSNADQNNVELNQASGNAYQLFILAVLTSISYTLARYYDMIPLDVRSFFSKSLLLDSTDQFSSKTAGIPVMCVDAHLSTSGTLLIFSSHDRRRSLGHLMSPNAIFPTSSKDEEYYSLVSSSSRFRAAGACVHWKSAAQAWLRSKGLTLAKGNAPVAWRLVPIVDGDVLSLIDSGPMPLAANMTALSEWPAALCFRDHSQLQDEAPDVFSSHSPSAWENASNQTKKSRKLLDSFTFAQDWVLSSDDRRRTIDALRAAKQAEKEKSSAQAPAGGHDISIPSSPVYARTGELAGVSAIYPTPPDGFASQAPNSSSIVAPDLPSELRNEDFREQEDPIVSSDLHLNDESPELAESAEQTSEFHNELFDDMEEDGFGATGVTDADFSFFDEPEADDIDLAFEEAEEPTDVGENSLNMLASKHRESAVDTQPSSVPEKTDGPEPLLNEFPTEHIAQNQSEDEGLQPQHASAVSDVEPCSNESIVQNTPSQAITPELSPTLVQKRLFQDTGSSENANRHQVQILHENSKTFNPVSFGGRVSTFDQKYGNSGRFGFDLKKENPSPGQKRTGSTAAMGSTKKLPFEIGNLHGASRSKSSTTAANNYPSEESTDEGYSSDTDSDSHYNEEEFPYQKGSNLTSDEADSNYRQNKRQRNGSDSGAPYNEQTASPEKPLSTIAESGMTTEQEAHYLLSQIDSKFEESVYRSLPGSSGKPDPQNPQSNGLSELRTAILHDKGAISIAQTISNTHIKSSFDDDSQTNEVASCKVTETSSIENLMESALLDVVKKLFPSATECDLLGLVSLQEATLDIQSTKPNQRPILQRKQTEGPGPYSNSIFRIQPPYVKVQRSEKVLHVLPPAIHFWDSLGLGPFNGPKDLFAYCIYPSNRRTEKALTQFFDCLASTYENRKFGIHEMDRGVVKSHACFFPYDLDMEASPTETVHGVQSACVAATKSLAVGAMDEKNLVVYLVNPFDDCTMFAGLCQAVGPILRVSSQSIFGPRTGHPRPNIIIKILNIDDIPPEDAILDPNPEYMLRLAHEIYERSVLSGPDGIQSGLNIRLSPAIQLTTAIPKSIQFKMTADPPSDLLEENSFFHMAYSRSPSDQWLTAAWTDNTGQYQTSASYSLCGRKFEEVAYELWDTTIGILKSKNISWRVIVAKEGLFVPGEPECWTKLFSTPAQLQIITTLISVEVKPCLTISSDGLLSSVCAENGGRAHSYSNGNPANIGTPVSTPTPTADGSSAAPSPSAAADNQIESSPDSRLIDQADETWGAVLGTRLRTSPVLGDWSPSLISGLLVKRGDSSHPPEASLSRRMPCIAVHVNWIGNNAASAASSGISSSSSAPLPGTMRSYEMLMKEVLNMYRCLGTLAKVKFMDDGMGGVVPWHILAAMRGANALDRCLSV